MTYTYCETAMWHIMMPAAFRYLSETQSDWDIPTLKRRSKQIYRQIVSRTPDIGSMMKNPLRVCMTAGMLWLSVYEAAEGRMSENRFEGMVNASKQLLGKIEEILERSKTQSYIKMDRVQWRDSLQTDDIIDDKFITESFFDKPAFCMAEHFYVRHTTEDKNLKEDSVVFIKPFKLKNANYIMLSATASEKICQQFFGSDNMVFHNCKQVKYKGNLYQYFGRSMSRSSIANGKNVVESIMRAMGFNDQNTITFANQGIGQIHFGNTDGLNAMEGKDLLVIGTPYHPEFLYKLVAHNLGFSFNEDERMSPQYISHNGYKTWFTTFKDENLRAVHFWMIESELE